MAEETHRSRLGRGLAALIGDVGNDKEPAQQQPARGQRLFDLGSPKDLALFLARDAGCEVVAADLLEDAILSTQEQQSAAAQVAAAMTQIREQADRLAADAEHRAATAGALEKLAVDLEQAIAGGVNDGKAVT